MLRIINDHFGIWVCYKFVLMQLKVETTTGDKAQNPRISAISKWFLKRFITVFFKQLFALLNKKFELQTNFEMDYTYWISNQVKWYNF